MSKKHSSESPTLSHRAAMQRLRRYLAHKGLFICACRFDSRWYPEIGRYYVVNESNFIEAKGIDIEEWARDAGLIGANVVVEDERSS